jgi:hypothetical protein
MGAVQKICFIIRPYQNENGWFFNDYNLGIFDEGLTCGTPEVIQKLCSIAQLNDFYAIAFSDRLISKHYLNYVKPDRDGSQYYWPEQDMFCWFCPTLLRYFKKPPKILWFDIFSSKNKNYCN